MNFKKVAVPLVFAVLYVVFNFLLTFLSLGFYDFLIALVTLVFLGFYVFYLAKFVNESLFKITAHILVIKNEGIDPKTTPVYQKYKMFKLYFKALVVYCVLTIVELIIEVFSGDLVWLNQLASDITNFILLCFLFYIFMLKQKRYNGYLMFEENGDVEECSQNDIQNFQAEGIENAGGNEWDENTPLPPPPVIVGYGSTEIPQSKGAKAPGENEYNLDNLDSTPNAPDDKPKDAEKPHSPYENPIVVQQT